MSLWNSIECGDRRKSKKRNRPNLCTVDEKGARTEGGKEGWEEIRKVMRILES
jgi:hypothetical protein